MDQDWNARPNRSPAGDAAEIILPSRRKALASLAAADESRGLLLLIGEPGVGKTWLARRWANEQMRGDRSVRCIGIDLSTTTTPAGLLADLATNLGLTTLDTASADLLRLKVRAELAERSAEGHRRALVVDEAHSASLEVLEEIRILSNRLAQPDGFAAILLVGQTTLASRLKLRCLSGLDSRIETSVHLRSLDLDEATAWLKGLTDRSHRDAEGNPSRLIRTTRKRTGEAAPVASGREPTPRIPAQPRPIVPATSLEGSPLVPAKPPLRMEDGLIEVGWEPETAADGDPEPMIEAEVTATVEAMPPAELPESEISVDRDIPAGEEVIDDPMTSLQAWNEWTANRDRISRDSDVEVENPWVGDQPSRLRADPEQEFAPYRQLFSRIHQRRQPEES